MLKKLLLPLALVLSPSYSYSESIAPYFGYTGNAITDQSLAWSMPNILPDPSGLDIQNVIYSYKIQKETGEWVTVHVQNENANATGYIFRETDEWKPGSVAGTGISKAVPVGNLPRALWGEGSIDVDGNGSIDQSEWDRMAFEDKRLKMLDDDAQRDAQRKMAWFALFGMLLYPFAIILCNVADLDEAMKSLASIAGVYFVSVAAIVAAFYGKEAYTKGKANNE